MLLLRPSNTIPSLRAKSQPWLSSCTFQPRWAFSRRCEWNGPLVSGRDGCLGWAEDCYGPPGDCSCSWEPTTPYNHSQSGSCLPPAHSTPGNSIRPHTYGICVRQFKWPALQRGPRVIISLPDRPGAGGAAGVLTGGSGHRALWVPEPGESAPSGGWFWNRLL